MATTSEPTYIWEWGIDWDAVQEPLGRSHLRQGLVRLAPTPGMTSPIVKQGETIKIRIFDLTENPPAAEIDCIAIQPRRAEVGEPEDVHPLSDLPCTVTACGDQTSIVFERSFTSFWESDKVTVSETGNFLLTFVVHARAEGRQPRHFRQDPEMVVGPNGG